MDRGITNIIYLIITSSVVLHFYFNFANILDFMKRKMGMGLIKVLVHPFDLLRSCCHIEVVKFLIMRRGMAVDWHCRMNVEVVVGNGKW
jgi:hypothetical protein